MEYPNKESSRNLKEGNTQRKMDGWSKMEYGWPRNDRKGN
jgi:hypothetical protein